jgi:adenine-specific DNA-methyltransferase
MPELLWEGKYDDEGRRVAPLRVSLPFQTVETVNESAQERQRSLDFFAGERPADWRNRLVWGDKKYVLPALLAEFAGEVDLIYIDPPFATGDDFSYAARVPSPGSSNGAATTFDKIPSLIEQKAYRDTWGRGLDSYLDWFAGMAAIFRELLSDTGSLYVHCDSRVNTYVRIALEEIFGADQLRNEIRWIRSLPHNDPTQYGRSSDTILYFSKTDRRIFHPPFVPQKPESVSAHYREDDNGRLYRLASLLAPGGRGPKYVYKGYERNWRFTEDKMLELEAAGRVWFQEGQMPSRIYYLDESQGSQVQDVWTDIAPLNPMAKERVGYPTQKPEGLLRRIIEASSDEGGLVLDCLCGSGTTPAVAETLGRRWIAADLGRFAIHTARKRLLAISELRPFVVQNLGKYERQLWQEAEFGESATLRTAAYRGFILDLYHATPINGYSWLHGLKQGRMVHVGTVDAPVTTGDVRQIVVEFRKAVGTGKDAPESQSVDILGWDFAFELNEIARQDAQKANIDLRLVRIPREVLDKRAVEQGDIRFSELAALSVDLKKAGRKVKMTLEDFIIPLDDVPADVQQTVTHWSQWIDYWAVDWDNKDDTFHNEWQAYRITKSHDLSLATEHEYEEAGEYAVVVKVIDILGNDTTKTMSVKVAGRGA